MYLSHSFANASARIAAVVVQSPAVSFVFDAASLTKDAQMFSNLSSRSISFATVTPSFVTVGPQYDFSSNTFLPFGHIVTLTASAIIFIPAYTRFLASSPYTICLAMVKKK
jgi:hypothetical protein